MSEQGWRDFLSADDVDDWVILHGGPTAVFRVGSLQEAAILAAAVAEVPGLEPRTLLTAASDRSTVKLTREMWGSRPATSRWLAPSPPSPASTVPLPIEAPTRRSSSPLPPSRTR